RHAACHGIRREVEVGNAVSTSSGAVPFLRKEERDGVSKVTKRGGRMASALSRCLAGRDLAGIIAECKLAQVESLQLRRLYVLLGPAQLQVAPGERYTTRTAGIPATDSAGRHGP